MRAHVVTAHGARHARGVGAAARVEREADAEVLGEVLVRRVHVPRAGDVTCLVAAEAREGRNRRVHVEARRGAEQDERARVLHVPRRVRERDDPAERCAEHDRSVQIERFAQGDDVVRPVVDRPPCKLAVVAAPVAAVVVVDELRDLGQRVELRPEDRVVDARPAVKREDRRPLAHRVALGRELRAEHLDEEARTSDRDPHGWIVDAATLEVLNATSRWNASDVPRSRRVQDARSSAP
ncbi:MAG TPA: hypothetical protein VE444_02345 [Gaiellaceae bacterium]|nr:hypothetical protein [Gaiellaceae bacterium]